jgi:hypothetical protein
MSLEQWLVSVALSVAAMTVGTIEMLLPTVRSFPPGCCRLASPADAAMS